MHVFTTHAIYVAFFTDESVLNGASEDIERPIFSFSSWSDQSYQRQMSAHLDQDMGFASWMVRSINQLRFSLFRETANKSMIIGDNEFLYEKIQVDAVAGNDYPGDVPFTERWGI